MTRLTTQWLADLESNMLEQERLLQEVTGLDYLHLAAKASNRSFDELAARRSSARIAAIPITTGQGIIGSFAETVAAVTSCMGFDSFVTDRTDVAGLKEAYQRGAEIIYLADDDRFITMNLDQRLTADNDQATAAGYVAALEGMLALRGLPPLSKSQQPILLLGCGGLGREFLKILSAKGAVVTLYDKEKDKALDLQNNGTANSLLTHVNQIRNYQIVVDATSEGGWLTLKFLHPELLLAAPGVPFSLDANARAHYSKRFIHDVLPIGVAAMLGSTLSLELEE